MKLLQKILKKIIKKSNEYENIFFCDEEMVYYAPNIEHLGNIINVEEIAQYPMVQYSPYYLMNAK